MNDQWKQDPRLKAMNPEKIRFLEDFAAQLSGTPKDQVLTRFIAMSSEAQRQVCCPESKDLHQRRPEEDPSENP